jgi:transketolase
MPSSDVFDNQDDSYRESILPSSITIRVAIEAGVTDTWWRYVGSQGSVIGLDQFGESAPAEELFEHFGFTTENVIKVVKNALK